MGVPALEVGLRGSIVVLGKIDSSGMTSSCRIVWARNLWVLHSAFLLPAHLF